MRREWNFGAEYQENAFAISAADGRFRDGSNTIFNFRPGHELHAGDRFRRLLWMESSSTVRAFLVPTIQTIKSSGPVPKRSIGWLDFRPNASGGCHSIPRSI